MEIANDFAKDLSFQGLTITSGMAVGIDSCAHYGALEANGNTIAVLGSGFNNIYPKENIPLYNKILDNNGLVVSEYSPNTKYKSEYFLKRNRIVSGLSIGVLVVEAAYRSGTSVTASLARSQGKKVFCVPHNLNDKHGVGINRLIQSGSIVATCVKDIVKQYDFLKYKEPINNKIKEVTKVKIEPQFLEIYNLLIGPPLNITQICNKCNKSVQFINNALIILELNGNITKTKEGYQANE